MYRYIRLPGLFAIHACCNARMMEISLKLTEQKRQLRLIHNDGSNAKALAEDARKTDRTIAAYGKDGLPKRDIANVEGAQQEESS